MFAVIFKAITAEQDDNYTDMVSRMRTLAFEKYGCLDFIAVTEGKQEIAISYWPTEQAILDWKADLEHAEAQRQGRQTFYQQYQVEVVEIKHQYRFSK